MNDVIEKPFFASGWTTIFQLTLFIGFFGDFELFAGAQLLCLHAVGAHDLIDADVIFAGDFPKIVPRLDGVQLPFGF